MNTDILAIIQARIGSTRLPGKVLLDLEGKTVLERVYERVFASRKIDKVIVATTVSENDLKLVETCAKSGISVYCGSEEDVLDRYYQAAKLFGAKHIIRITSDCPLIDPAVIDDVIELYFRGKVDYALNTLKETYPDGEDVEVFSFKTLKKAWKEANLLSEREHVTPYIRNHPEYFSLANLEFNEDHSAKRWTLDNKEDYKLIKVIYANLYHENNLFSMQDILTFLSGHPELEEINSHIGRNEGYAKSLKEDKLYTRGE